MTAGCLRVLFACRMGALVALFRRGAVTLCCSFMVIRGANVCIFGHTEELLFLLLYCTSVPILRFASDGKHLPILLVCCVLICCVHAWRIQAGGRPVAWLGSRNANLIAIVRVVFTYSIPELHVRRVRPHLGRQGVVAVGNLFLRVAAPAPRPNRRSTRAVSQRIAIRRPAGLRDWYDDGHLQRWQSNPLLGRRLLDQLNFGPLGYNSLPRPGDVGYVLVGLPVFFALSGVMGRRVRRVLSAHFRPSRTRDLGYGLRGDRCTGSIAIHALARRARELDKFSCYWGWHSQPLCGASSPRYRSWPPDA
jgi:hypothetical protein